VRRKELTTDDAVAIVVKIGAKFESDAKEAERSAREDQQRKRTIFKQTTAAD